jgi:hypothetical protein
MLAASGCCSRRVRLGRPGVFEPQFQPQCHTHAWGSPARMQSQRGSAGFSRFSATGFVCFEVRSFRGALDPSPADSGAPRRSESFNGRRFAAASGNSAERAIQALHHLSAVYLASGVQLGWLQHDPGPVVSRSHDGFASRFNAVRIRSFSRSPPVLSAGIATGSGECVSSAVVSSARQAAPLRAARKYAKGFRAKSTRGVGCGEKSPSGHQ